MPFLSPNQQCQSTEGNNITFHGLKLTWDLPTLTTNNSWLPCGRVAMPLISPLMPVPLPATYYYCYYYSRFLFYTWKMAVKAETENTVCCWFLLAPFSRLGRVCRRPPKEPLDIACARVFFYRLDALPDTEPMVCKHRTSRPAFLLSFGVKTGPQKNPSSLLERVAALIPNDQSKQRKTWAATEICSETTFGVLAQLDWR